jgi:hypothetical protein
MLSSPGVRFPHPRYMELTWIAIYRIAVVWVVAQVETSS